MGYAIFTARKLMLTNRVNQLSMRILQLSQQQQTLADNAARMERAMAASRNLFSTIGNAFQMGMTMQQTLLGRELAASIENNKGKTDSAETKALADQMLRMAMSGGGNFMATGMGATLSTVNQLMETVNQNKMRQVKDMETQIELQRKSLETQLNAAQKELEKVEQQEDKEIERSAPKFA